MQSNRTKGSAVLAHLRRAIYSATKSSFPIFGTDFVGSRLVPSVALLFRLQIRLPPQKTCRRVLPTFEARFVHDHLTSGLSLWAPQILGACCRGPARWFRSVGYHYSFREGYQIGRTDRKRDRQKYWKRHRITHKRV